MSKLPGVYFYPDNYCGGTRLFSYEEKGRYMDLLMLQAQIYPEHIPQDSFVRICGGSNNIRNKFVTDDSGCLYNERMERELHKSYTRSEAARKKILKRWGKNTGVSTPVSTGVYTGVDTGVYTGGLGGFSESVKKVEKPIPEYIPEYKNDTGVYTGVDTINNFNIKSFNSLSFNPLTLKEDNNNIQGRDIEESGDVTEVVEEDGDSESVVEHGTIFGDMPLPPQAKVRKDIKHKRGQYGRVLLSDDEMTRLNEKYGEDEVAAMIAHCDGVAERTENRAGYKRWVSVIHTCAKCGWHKKGGYGGVNSGDNRTGIGINGGINAAERQKNFL